MCGRFTLLTDLSVIEESFHIQEVTSDYRPGNNIAPTQHVSAIIKEDVIMLVDFRWGLIPSWAKDPSLGNKMFNARAETIADKPSFRSAFQKRRCLIIADGFYEWPKHEKGKPPFHISLKSGAPFGFASLYETWISPDNRAISTCTLITTEPNELIKPIHERMPVIVPKDKEELWMDAHVLDQEALLSLLVPYPSDAMKMSAGFLPMR